MNILSQTDQKRSNMSWSHISFIIPFLQLATRIPQNNHPFLSMSSCNYSHRRIRNLIHIILWIDAILPCLYTGAWTPQSHFVSSHQYPHKVQKPKKLVHSSMTWSYIYLLLLSYRYINPSIYLGILSTYFIFLSMPKYN